MDFEELEKVFDEATNIAKKKNNDYGDKPIVDLGTEGLMIRIFSKANRMKNLEFSNKNAEVKDESKEDTAIDIINYCAYYVMLNRNKYLSQKDLKNKESLEGKCPIDECEHSVRSNEYKDVKYYLVEHMFNEHDLFVSGEFIDKNSSIKEQEETK